MTVKKWVMELPTLWRGSGDFHTPISIDIVPLYIVFLTNSQIVKWLSQVHVYKWPEVPRYPQTTVRRLPPPNSASQGAYLIFVIFGVNSRQNSHTGPKWAFSVLKSTLSWKKSTLPLVVVVVTFMSYDKVRITSLSPAYQQCIDFMKQKKNISQIINVYFQ